MQRALSGIRVLALNHALAGPFGAMILADLGAEIILIERPEGRQDLSASKMLKGESVYFMSLNRNKKSFVVDLQNHEGLSILYDLVRKSDVVFDNFRPGVMKKLRIDYETLSKINPGIICCSISGYGQTGPYRERAGYDYLMQAYGGAMSVTGEPDGPPTKFGLSIIDHTGGMYAVIGILAALKQRERTGHGQYVDIALLDTQISFLTYLAGNYFADGEIAQRIPASGHPFGVPAQLFPSRNGYVFIFASNNDFFGRLCKVMGKPELANDPRFETPLGRLNNKNALIEILKKIVIQKNTEEWLDDLLQAGVPVAPINNIDQALNDPQVLARNMVINMEHPVCGPIKAVGNPVQLSASEDISVPPPVYGQHTYEVLSEILQYSDEKCRDLENAKIVFCERRAK